MFHISYEGTGLAHVIEISDVVPGDVLVAYSSSFVEKSSMLGYSHAAICCSEGIVAESCVKGIRKTTIEKILEEYEHIAVFRQVHLWNSERIAKLNDFVDAAISSKAKFNVQGIRDYEEARIEHDANLLEKLSGYFDGSLKSPSSDQSSYFCSELVAAAFIAVGILTPSAAVVFDPRIMSP